MKQQTVRQKSRRTATAVWILAAVLLSGCSGGKAEETNTAVESARLKKYQEVLTDILERQTYPNGEDCGYHGFYPLLDNQFAVLDVDKDGEEELILCFTTSSTAGMREIVYAYEEETDSVREEYTGFPGVVFYENGLIEEKMSHNHGMAPVDDFWPYMVHRYESESDSYECLFTVAAWEKEYMEEDYDGNPYPEEVDAEKAGTVYFVMDGCDYDYTAADPVSKGAYEEWRKTQGLESTETEITFRALTKENIENILQN